tara:strand:+ start:10088 stop:10894 length:807 start_codon:yes stop_codon:yes gene_type:complete
MNEPLNLKQVEIKGKSTEKYFFRSLYALTIQEIISTDGRLYGGAFYTVLRPLITTLLIVFISQSLNPNLSLAEGLAIFLLPFANTFFLLDIISRSGHINEGLLNLPHVKITSLLISGIISRFISYLPVYLICSLILFLFDVEFSIVRIFFTSLLICFTSSSYLLIASMILFRNSILQNFHTFLPRALFFLSGTFIPMKNLSFDIQWYFYLNPIVHINEYARMSVGEYNYETYSINYPLFFAAILFILYPLFYHIRVNIFHYGDRTILK